MTYRVLHSREAHWRPSNQMKVENTDLATQLEAETLGTRIWRLRPGQASTKHRHFDQHELYVLLEGTGRIRVDEEVFTLEPHSAVFVEPEHVRQLFNDTDADVLWLIVGAPRESVSSTLEMSDEQLAAMYPDGPKAMPPELGGGQFAG
jgi:quercetin dioxygenase-like cupin family protein